MLCSSPVNIIVQLVVCVMPLLIDSTLCAPLPTTRQQLEEAHLGPMMLSCTSTARQLKLAGWV